MHLQVMWNSILLTLEALINLLKEIKTIGKNLGKIRARKGERADQREVIVDAWGRRQRFATDQRANRKGRSLSTKREVAVGESTARGGRSWRGVRHRRISALWTSSSSFGSSNPQEDRRRCELGELQMKSGLREHRHLVVMSIERFFVRFRSFVATGGSRMRIN